MTQPSDIAVEESGRGRRRVVNTLIGISAAVIFVVVVWQLLLRMIVPMALPNLDPDRAEVVARRVGVAFTDAEQSWSRYFNEQGQAEPGPANMILFTRTQPSPCAGSTPATGPFYCPVDNVAGFDLAFLDSLENAMSREAELGTAVVVARIIASHVQDSVSGGNGEAMGDNAFARGRVLHADCLAGVWAGMAEDRLGTVPPGFYARLVSNAQGVTEENAKAGLKGQPALDPFHLSDHEARENAFSKGQAAADPAVCANLG